MNIGRDRMKNQGKVRIIRNLNVLFFIRDLETKVDVMYTKEGTQNFKWNMT